jgi:hypothetical protein
VKTLRLGFPGVRTFVAVLPLLFSILLPRDITAQSVPYAHTYAKSKEEVDQALKDMQAYPGQKLPIVDGFVASGDKPLNRYERAFYQFSIDLLPGTSGGTIVRVSAKITAWYADQDPAKSGYEVLPSNGRLELDLLDRLDEKLAGKPVSSGARTFSNPGITAPKPKLDLGNGSGTASPAAGPSASSGSSHSDELGGLRVQREAEEKRSQQLSQELQSLQEIQKNQAHPRNLVVVKRSGAPVVSRPAEGSRVLFNASADDEFEFLDAEGEWIHVLISGESRGYIRKSNLELPELIAERLQTSAAAAAKAPAFRVAREESSVFPGDWEPLRGKTVKIYTVQPATQDQKETGPRAKLNFAVSLFQKYPGEAAAGPPVDGVVVIFDSADGGIVGTTMPGIKQLADGSLSQDNFWKQCYLDPPDAFQTKSKPQ